MVLAASGLLLTLVLVLVLHDCVITVSSTGAEDQFQADDNGHVGRPCEVSLAPPYPELSLRDTGPLPSLVLRAEDMWRKRKPMSSK